MATKLPLGVPEGTEKVSKKDYLELFDSMVCPYEETQWNYEGTDIKEAYILKRKRTNQWGFAMQFGKGYVFGWFPESVDSIDKADTTLASIVAVNSSGVESEEEEEAIEAETVEEDVEEDIEEEEDEEESEEDFEPDPDLE
jgi:nucleosome binding factor SPN SPT16 subunit